MPKVDLEEIPYDMGVWNECYEKIASKRKWQNRDFDQTFDDEVDDLYDAIVKSLYEKKVK